MEPDEDEPFHPGLEDVFISDDLRNSKIATRGNKFVEKARKMVKHENVCSGFCGGKKCKYCMADCWKEKDQAIKGLYSHWVTDNILAMSRPTNEAIRKYDIINQFIKNNIRTVINLQQRGEHAYCGPGNDETGFSYNSQHLMEKGLFFYNFGWDDFGVGNVKLLLDIVKVMQFSLSEGKVAIHCHAGLGRTGLLIACYLVYNNRLPPDEAVTYIRSKRPGSIQTQSQVKMVKQFEAHILPYRCVFAENEEGEFSLQQHLNRQRELLHGFEARKLKYVPKIVYICCERLLELANCGNSLNRSQSYNILSTRTFLSPPDDKTESSSYPDISRSRSLEIISNSRNQNGRPREMDDASSVGSGSLLSIKRPLSNQVLNIMSEKSFSSDSQSIDSSESYDLLEAERSQPDSVYCSQECRLVGEALTSDFTSHVEEKVNTYQERLNLTDEAWKELSNEADANVVAALLWKWLDHLRQPILCKQELTHIKTDADKPMQALKKMDKGTKSVVEYLAKVVVKLNSLPRAKQENIIERILSHLCHQAVLVKTTTMEKTGSEKEHWSTMKGKTAMRLFYFFQKLMEELQETGAITKR